jgi:hypothetical protein
LENTILLHAVIDPCGAARVRRQESALPPKSDDRQGDRELLPFVVPDYG